MISIVGDLYWCMKDDIEQLNGCLFSGELIEIRQILTLILQLIDLSEQNAYVPKICKSD